MLSPFIYIMSFNLHKNIMRHNYVFYFIDEKMLCISFTTLPQSRALHIFADVETEAQRG